VTGAEALAAITEMFGMVEDLEMDIPMVGSYIVSWAADLVAAGYIELAALQEPLVATGKAPRLGAKLLNFTAAAITEDKASALFDASGLDIKSWMHPEDCEAPNWISTYATDNKLEWLFPFLACETYLHQAFAANEDPDNITAWLRSNVAPERLMSTKGARFVVRSLLSHFSKNQEDFKKYAKTAETLYHPEDAEAETTKLQLGIIYEVQLFCNENSFESGLVKKLFHALYECEIVGEEAFDMWREDTDETTPGKRRALLEANTFIQWLAEAEEEGEEGSEEDQ